MEEQILDVKVEEITPVKKKFSFVIPWENVKKELDQVYRDVGKKAKIKGFRPGKVPLPVLQTHYKEYAEGETVQNLVNRHYREAIERERLTPVSQPEVDPKSIEPEQALLFTATVEVEPVVEPKNYAGLELEKIQTDVTDADLEARLLQIREMYGTLEEISDDRELQEKHFATIDFSGTIDGQALDELKSENYFLEVGSHTFIPGFEEQLVGMKKGETRDIQVKFPDDYGQAQLADKDVRFSVSLKGIREKKLPPLDEEFVKNFEQYDSLEALMADVRSSLEGDQKGRDEAAFQEVMVDALLKENPFEVPMSLVERQTFYLMTDMQRRMTWAGMDKQQAAELSFGMHEKLKEQAGKIVKTMFLMRAIADREGLTVTEEDLDAQLHEMAAKLGKDIPDLRSKLAEEGSLEQVRMDLLQRKTFRFVEEKATVTIRNAAASEGEDR
ncbi:MAG: trigger factor [Syntrophales bacterium]